MGPSRLLEAIKFDLSVESSRNIPGALCAKGSRQKDSLKPHVIAREYDVLEFRDELDNRWINGWTAPPKPLRELSYGDHRHLHACPQLHHDGGEDRGVAETARRQGGSGRVGSCC